MLIWNFFGWRNKRAQKRHGCHSWPPPKLSYSRGSRRIEWSQRKQRGLDEWACQGVRHDGTGRPGLWGAWGHLQVPAWYLRALTLCLWAVNVRTRSPVSASQHLTVLSALPEYTCRFTSCGRGEGGRLAPDTAGRLRSPSKPLCVSREGHVQVLVEKLWMSQKCPCPGVPPAHPLWCLRSCCPPPTSSAGQWGSGGLAGIRQIRLQSLTGPWPSH